MNEEEKKAIARVERLYKFSQDVNHTAIVLTEDTRCLGIVLNLLQQEKEKNKKLEEEEELDEALIDMYFEKEEVYNKVIDMMAEEILKITKANDISNYLKQFSNYDIDFIKQYYFKKARGEENETN